MNEGQGHTAKGFREQTWLRAALGLGSALITQELSSAWGRHLPPTDLYPLALAVGMSIYNLHIFKVKPATDHRSRLRAIWYPKQKNIAVGVTFTLFLLSLVYAYHRLHRPVKEISLDRINSLRPISSGLMTVSGAPNPDEKPYRWVFSESGDEEDAPYLTPLKNFKGQLIIVSSDRLTRSLESERGWISELSIYARPHYVAYRNYMGLSPNAPIFLFDIRGLWWFDPHSIAGAIIALVLFIATLGSTTRDPENRSRLLYIPPELRDFDHDEMTNFDEQSVDKELDLEDSTGSAELQSPTEAEELAHSKRTEEKRAETEG